MAEKNEYRLGALLELRERSKDEAERYLGDCNAALEQERERQREMERELERMIARRETKKREYAEKQMRGEMSAQGAVAANVYIDRLKEQEEMQQNAIEGQKGVVAQREQDVETAREELVEANQNLKALEKHKEKWQEEIKKEQQKKQEEALDEIAQSVYRYRTW